VTDSLLRWRDEFPALERTTYLVSHSLGAMPRAAVDHMRAYTDLWVQKGINAWEDWLPEVDRAGERVGKIIGAPNGTVVMATNVSQIQASVASCFEYVPGKNKIVYTDLEFPSVSYLWQEETRRGAVVEVVPSEDGIHPPMERLLAAIDSSTLIVPVSHVVFRSSAQKDVKALVARAHEVGALVLLDCYQSAGTVPVDVIDLDVDLACGGSVKWLCGGPGASYLYVKKEILPSLKPRNTGWFGHAHPFAFTMPAQEYADSTWRMMAGTPAIAALYQARAGADLIGEIGVAAIREKSLRQTTRVMAICDAAGYTINTPRADAQRGGTVCFDFPRAELVAKELNRTGFLCDHRPKSGIRMSPHFYTTDEEIERFMTEVARLKVLIS